MNAFMGIRGLEAERTGMYCKGLARLASLVPRHLQGYPVFRDGTRVLSTPLLQPSMARETAYTELLYMDSAYLHYL
jgi:hypothetical protein